MSKSPRILVAPLNWGLGHATRCVPIIQALQKQGIEVLIGSDGEALRLLQLEFPDLETIELPSYNIQYRYANMFINIAPQIPKLLRVVQLERQFLDGIIQSHKIDALISDNRYGLSSPKIYSIFITHQLNIKIPNPLLKPFVNRINHHLIKKFDACWVPDFESYPGLSGELGHLRNDRTSNKLKNIQYIGPLSRLEKPILDVFPKTYDIVAILSGPEPQRTYFEEKILAQLIKLPLRSLLVQGNPNKEESMDYHKNVAVKSFLNAAEVAWHLSSAGLVIARSGYSTLMDMAKIGRHQTLLVPTPGQTEQEYLALELVKKNKIIQQSQKQLDIAKAWENKDQCQGFQSIFQPELLEQAVTSLVKRIKK